MSSDERASKAGYQEATRGKPEQAQVPVHSDLCLRQRLPQTEQVQREGSSYLTLTRRVCWLNNVNRNERHKAPTIANVMLTDLHDDPRYGHLLHKGRQYPRLQQVRYHCVQRTAHLDYSQNFCGHRLFFLTRSRSSIFWLYYHCWFSHDATSRV